MGGAAVGVFVCGAAVVFFVCGGVREIDMDQCAYAPGRISGGACRMY